jgi:NADH:ubiquinone reductase (non-electrogenic)
MKKRIIILGTGFAAFRFLKKIDISKFEVTVVSPRNHFLFTPLLPSTTVGTIEFRSIIEPIRNIENIIFYQSNCSGIDKENNKIICTDTDTETKFELEYDYLVIAVGEVTNTFNVEGVDKYALFLKELSDARKIRTKVVDCFENASLPGNSIEKRKQYLRFVVCGGGPTGVEFAAELHDFIEDVKKKYPEISKDVEIILVESKNKLLASFDEKLSGYTMKIFERQSIKLLMNTYITSLNESKIFLNSGEEIEYGLLVWATGNTSTALVRNSGFEVNKQGKPVTDNFFRVKSHQNIFAIGDCAGIENKNLPATAQVAQQQGVFLAKYFNEGMKQTEEFEFKSLGMLAYVGDNKALADTSQYKGTGFKTFILWRSAYLTKLVSLKNKVLVIFDWIKTFIFGRDISNF